MVIAGRYQYPVICAILKREEGKKEKDSRKSRCNVRKRAVDRKQEKEKVVSLCWKRYGEVLYRYILKRSKYRLLDHR